jgi:hypothetical protein
MFVHWWSPDAPDFTWPSSERIPKLSKTARRNTIVEWPREKKNPTLRGRFS